MSSKNGVQSIDTFLYPKDHQSSSSSSSSATVTSITPSSSSSSSSSTSLSSSWICTVCTFRNSSRTLLRCAACDSSKLPSSNTTTGMNPRKSNTVQSTSTRTSIEVSDDEDEVVETNISPNAINNNDYNNSVTTVNKDTVSPSTPLALPSSSSTSAAAESTSQPSLQQQRSQDNSITDNYNHPLLVGASTEINPQQQQRLSSTTCSSSSTLSSSINLIPLSGFSPSSSSVPLPPQQSMENQHEQHNTTNILSSPSAVVLPSSSSSSSTTAVTSVLARNRLRKCFSEDASGLPTFSTLPTTVSSPTVTIPTSSTKTTMTAVVSPPSIPVIVPPSTTHTVLSLSDTSHHYISPQLYTCLRIPSSAIKLNRDRNKHPHPSTTNNNSKSKHKRTTLLPDSSSEEEDDRSSNEEEEDNVITNTMGYTSSIGNDDILPSVSTANLTSSYIPNGPTLVKHKHNLASETSLLIHNIDSASENDDDHSSSSSSTDDAMGPTADNKSSGDEEDNDDDENMDVLLFDANDDEPTSDDDDDDNDDDDDDDNEDQENDEDDSATEKHVASSSDDNDLPSSPIQPTKKSTDTSFFSSSFSDDDTSIVVRGSSSSLKPQPRTVISSTTTTKVPVLPASRPQLSSTIIEIEDTDSENETVIHSNHNASSNSSSSNRTTNQSTHHFGARDRISHIGGMIDISDSDDNLSHDRASYNFDNDTEVHDNDNDDDDIMDAGGTINLRRMKMHQDRRDHQNSNTSTKKSLTKKSKTSVLLHDSPTILPLSQRSFSDNEDNVDFLNNEWNHTENGDQRFLPINPSSSIVIPPSSSSSAFRTLIQSVLTGKDLTEDGFPDPLLPYYRPVRLLNRIQQSGRETIYIDYCGQFRGACAPVQRIPLLPSSSSSATSASDPYPKYTVTGTKGGALSTDEVRKQHANREKVLQSRCKERVKANKQTGLKRTKAKTRTSKTAKNGKGGSANTTAEETFGTPLPFMDVPWPMEATNTLTTNSRALPPGLTTKKTTNSRTKKSKKSSSATGNVTVNRIPGLLTVPARILPLPPPQPRNTAPILPMSNTSLLLSSRPTVLPSSSSSALSLSSVALLPSMRSNLFPLPGPTSTNYPSSSSSTNTTVLPSSTVSSSGSHSNRHLLSGVNKYKQQLALTVPPPIDASVLTTSVYGNTNRTTVMAGTVDDETLRTIDGALNADEAGFGVDPYEGKGFLVGPVRPPPQLGKYDPFRALGGYEGIGTRVTPDGPI